MPRNSVFNGILHKNFISLLNLAHFKLTKHCQGISTLKTNQPCHFNDPSFHFKLSKSHSISKPIISFRYSLVIQIIILTVTNYSIILLSKVIQTYHSIQISFHPRHFNFKSNSNHSFFFRISDSTVFSTVFSILFSTVKLLKKKTRF